MKRAQRENKPLSVALFDLDGFKSINDRLGHAVGDECLRLVASLVNQHKRAYDLVGRWGGEEFLVLLPGTNLEP